MTMDLAGFCRLIWNRRWQIALLIAFAVVASFAGIKLTKPVYQATARILIQEELPKDRYSFLYQRKQGPSNLVPNCVEILKGLGGQVLGTVKIQQVQGTDVIMVSVDATDPRQAVQSVNTLLKGLRLSGLSGGASGEKVAFDVRIVSPATLPTQPVNGGRAKTVLAIAIFLGLFAGCGLAIMLEYFDPSLKTGRDVQAYLGLPVIGIIPAPQQDSITKRFSNLMSRIFGQKREVGA